MRNVEQQPIPPDEKEFSADFVGDKEFEKSFQKFCLDSERAYQGLLDQTSPHDERNELEEKYQEELRVNLEEQRREERWKIISFDISPSIEQKLQLPDLPEGIGIRGGGARAVLMEALGLEHVEKPRDIDLIFNKELLDDPNKASEVKRALEDHMADDLLHLGLERCTNYCSIESPDEHFRTQDFTINEVYLMNDKLYATKQCIQDIRSGTLRVTEFEKENWNRTGLGPKMMTKAMRFLSCFEEKYGHGEIHGEEELEFGQIPVFWIFLNLRKSLEEGQQVATSFWRKVTEKVFDREKLGLLEKRTDREFCYEACQNIFKLYQDDPARAFIGLTVKKKSGSDKFEENKFKEIVEAIVSEKKVTELSPDEIENIVHVYLVKEKQLVRFKSVKTEEIEDEPSVSKPSAKSKEKEIDPELRQYAPHLIVKFKVGRKKKKKRN